MGSEVLLRVQVELQKISCEAILKNILVCRTIQRTKNQGRTVGKYFYFGNYQHKNIRAGYDLVEKPS